MQSSSSTSEKKSDQFVPTLELVNTEVEGCLTLICANNQSADTVLSKLQLMLKTIVSVSELTIEDKLVFSIKWQHLGYSNYTAFKALSIYIHKANYTAAEKILKTMPVELMWLALQLDILNKDKKPANLFLEVLEGVTENITQNGLLYQFLTKTPVEPLFNYTFVFHADYYITCKLLKWVIPQKKPELTQSFSRLIELLEPAAVERLLTTEIEESQSSSEDNLLTHLLSYGSVELLFKTLNKVSETVLLKLFIHKIDNLDALFYKIIFTCPERDFVKFISQFPSNVINQLMIHPRIFPSGGTFFQNTIAALTSKSLQALFERASTEAINVGLSLIGFKHKSGLELVLETSPTAELDMLYEKSPLKLKKMIIEFDPLIVTEEMKPAYQYFKSKFVAPLTAPIEEIKESKEIKEYEYTSDSKTEIITSADPSPKSTEELFAELKASHPELDLTNLKSHLTSVHSKLQRPSSIHPIEKKISDWDIKDCQAWSENVKRRKLKEDTEYIDEILAVIMRATELDVGYRPREVQMLSLLLFLNAKEKGRLLQIATGEGKSLIVAMFAVVKALFGKKVDIVTSSSTLASRDSKEKKNFYSYFNLTTRCNADKDSASSSSGPKECYRCDVVYGNAANFCWHLLSHELDGENTRGDRKYEIVIVDEVDSLMIDELNNTSFISTRKSGMDMLRQLFCAVWTRLPDIENEFAKLEQVSGFKLSVQEKRDTMQGILREYLHTLICDPESPIYIPKNIKEFALAQIDNWANNAIRARYDFHNGIDYVVKNNEILIIDEMTGESKVGNVWSGGVNQFVELKENVPITLVTLFGSFISNVGFFARYENNLYGLTGTLGGDTGAELLKFMYPIDTLIVPTFKQKRFKELPGKICETTEIWFANIISDVTEQASKGRGVLVICENIKTVDEIVNRLVRQDPNNKKNIIRYARSDSAEGEMLEKPLEAGQIIVATNLAGRGTDIKTTGFILYVCLTFMPISQRIDDQALGRTARKGKKGKARRILMQDPNKKSISSIEKLKEERDCAEFTSTEKLKVFDLPLILFKDRLFSQFCQLINELRETQNNQFKIRALINEFGEMLSQAILPLTTKKSIDEKIIAEIEVKFNAFLLHCRKKYTQDLNDPYLLIRAANEESDVKTSVAHLTKAIELDPILAVQAYYNRAYVKLGNGASREAAIEDFISAKKILEEHTIPQLQSIQLIQNLSADKSPPDSPLIKGIQSKIDFYEAQIADIVQAINFISNAEPDSTIAVQRSSKLYDTCSDLKLTSHDISELYESGLENFFDLAEIPPDTDDTLFGVLGVAILGTLQIVAGVALCCIGQEVVGAGLISEGIGDLIYAVKAAIDGRFSWSHYQATKTTSIAVTAITMGISAIRSGISSLKSAPVSTTVSQQLTRDRFVEIAKARIMPAIVHAGISETISFGLDQITKMSLKAFKDDIESAIKKEVLALFASKDLQVLLNKLFYDDEIHHHSTQAFNATKVAFGLIESKRHKIRQAMSIFSSVVSRQSRLVGAMCTGINIADALNEINSFVDDFGIDFVAALSIQTRPLTATSKDYPELREELCKQIISKFLPLVMANLHNGVIRPVAHTVLDSKMSELAQGIQRACFAPKMLREEIKDPALSSSSRFDEKKSAFDDKDNGKAIDSTKHQIVFSQDTKRSGTEISKDRLYINTEEFKTDLYLSAPRHRGVSDSASYSISKEIDLTHLLHSPSIAIVQPIQPPFFNPYVDYNEREYSVSRNVDLDFKSKIDFYRALDKKRITLSLPYVDKGVQKCIVLAGPLGFHIDLQELVLKRVNALQLQGCDVTLVGDGERDLTFVDIQKLLKQIKHNSVFQDGRTLLFITTHGDLENKEHYLALGEEFDLKTKNLLTLIAKNSNGKPIDIFSQACFGGSVCQIAPLVLPHNSNYVAMSHESVYEESVDNMLKALQNPYFLYGDLSAENLLKVYLTQAFGQEEMPIEVAPEICTNLVDPDLSVKLDSHLGRKFSDSERQIINDELSDFTTPEKLDLIMDEIESGRYLADSTAPEHGLALAIAHYAYKIKPTHDIPPEYQPPATISDYEMDSFDMGFPLSAPSVSRAKPSFIESTINFISDKSDEWKLPTRTIGLLQCAGGVGQTLASIASGALTLETGIGPLAAASYATIGVDNAIAGCTAAWTGREHHTFLNLGMQSVGLDPQSASYAEIGINLYPLAPTIVKEVPSQLHKVGIFSRKLADDTVRLVRRARTSYTNHSQAMFSELIRQRLLRNISQSNASRKIGDGFKTVSRKSNVVEFYGAKSKVNVAPANPIVDKMANVVEDYLGKDFKMFKNKSGEPIFMSANGTRKIRFDINNPHGYEPHAHVEVLNDGKWIDYIPGQHHIYFNPKLEPDLLPPTIKK